MQRRCYWSKSTQNQYRAQKPFILAGLMQFSDSILDSKRYFLKRKTFFVCAESRAKIEKLKRCILTTWMEFLKILSSLQRTVSYQIFQLSKNSLDVDTFSNAITPVILIFRRQQPRNAYLPATFFHWRSNNCIIYQNYCFYNVYWNLHFLVLTEARYLQIRISFLHFSLHFLDSHLQNKVLSGRIMEIPQYNHVQNFIQNDWNLRYCAPRFEITFFS